MTTGAEISPSLRLEAVVLAAGAGTRFGGAKLTSPWRGGGSLIDGALAAAFAAPARSVWVVTGADPGVAWAARTFATRSAAVMRLRIVHAARHAEGMSASMKSGLEALPTDTAGAFVFLGDMPAIPPQVPIGMAEALTAGAAACAPVFEGRRGHPVLFSAALFAQLRLLDGDAGARDLLKGLGSELALVESPDAGVLFDVDSPGDLESP